jgi:hypothetical protein
LPVNFQSVPVLILRAQAQATFERVSLRGAQRRSKKIAASLRSSQ